jgi:hypothetical protein
VSHKRLKPRWFRAFGPSVLGDGLPERLRSTLVALLGVTAAAGLGIVALALQQGFPLVGSGPLPDPPPRREALDDRVVAERKPVAPRRAPIAAPVPDDDPSAPSHGPGVVVLPGSTPPERSAELGIGSAPSDDEATTRKPLPPKAPSRPEPSPAAQVPVTVPVQEPSATPANEPAAPAPEAPAESATSPHPGNGHAYGRGNGNGFGNAGNPPGQSAAGLAHGHSKD